ncbi:MAG: hypothetical protein ACOCM4_15430 [Acetivibrio ethanolgignens]
MFWLACLVLMYFAIKELIEYLRHKSEQKYSIRPYNPNELDAKLLRYYYEGKLSGKFNEDFDWGEQGKYNFIKEMNREQLKEECDKFYLVDEETYVKRGLWIKNAKVNPTWEWDYEDLDKL